MSLRKKVAMGIAAMVVLAGVVGLFSSGSLNDFMTLSKPITHIGVSDMSGGVY